MSGDKWIRDKQAALAGAVLLFVGMLIGLVIGTLVVNAAEHGSTTPPTGQRLVYTQPGPHPSPTP